MESFTVTHLNFVLFFQRAPGSTRTHTRTRAPPKRKKKISGKHICVFVPRPLGGYGYLQKQYYQNSLIGTVVSSSWGIIRWTCSIQLRTEDWFQQENRKCVCVCLKKKRRNMPYWRQYWELNPKFQETTQEAGISGLCVCVNEHRCASAWTVPSTKLLFTQSSIGLRKKWPQL